MSTPENDKRNANLSDSSKLFIENILNSNELSLILNNKLRKYTTSKKSEMGLRKMNSDIPQLEDGYESEESNDSTKTKSTITTITTTLTDTSPVTGELIEFYKIRNEIDDLKTILPNNKNYTMNINCINDKDDSIDNNNKKMNNKNNSKKKTKKVVELYPLEFYEIFPKLKKFEVSYHSSNQDSIEKPLFFIKNLILKNYHESLAFTQNKFELQKFKNSSNDCNYEIMNISQPINTPLNNDDITCMTHGHYHSNPNTKDKNIKMVNDIVNKLKKTQTQIFQVEFIYFGYSNGIIRQYALVDIKADPLSENSLPADTFSLYLEYKADNLTNESSNRQVLCMSISDDEKYLLAGYASHHIIIWNTYKGNQVRCFNDIFDQPVVSCEFLSISENCKEFLFLVGDLIGKVRLVKYKINTFVNTHEIIIVSNCFYPCLIIKKLKLNKRDGDEDFNIKEMINKINDRPNHICIIGNLEYIELLLISKTSLKITSALIIKNPDLIILNPLTELIEKDREQFYSQSHLIEAVSNIEFPDATFGIGFIGDLIRNNDNKEPFILFAVGWKYQIQLYYFSKDLSNITEIGWYLNNSIIIKIGFIGTSLLYFIDKNNNVKIINVKLFNKISYERNNNYNMNKRIKNKFLIPLSDIIIIENPIKTISKEFNHTTNYYSPFIISTKYD